jgi:parvulin-like peptidyl-prolyl isomerase
MKNILLFILSVFAINASAQVVFTVGNSKVTVEEFKKRMKDYKETNNPPSTEQLLEDWIRFEVGVQEAIKEKLESDPQVKERFRQVMYNSLLEKTLGKKVEGIQINEADMKAYYRNNPEIRLNEIFIEYPAKATADQREIARKRANEIYEEVLKQSKAKRPFEDLVKLYSDDLATKDTGGDIGFQSRVTLLFYDTVIKHKVGDIIGPIDSKQGFYIVKLAGKNTYEEADKRQIRAAVFDEKRSHLFNDYFDKLKKQYHIQVNKEALKAAAS